MAEESLPTDSALILIFAQQPRARNQISIQKQRNTFRNFQSELLHLINWGVFSIFLVAELVIGCHEEQTDHNSK